jgi:hypothetical protein
VRRQLCTADAPAHAAHHPPHTDHDAHTDPCTHTHTHATGALNDYQKDLQFRKLNAQKDVIDIKVQRCGGKTALVKNNEIVVGDVMLLDTGVRLGVCRRARGGCLQCGACLQHAGTHARMHVCMRVA